METPRTKSNFVVPSLNSFNAHARAARMAAARKQYTFVNNTKPALPSLVAVIKPPAKPARAKPVAATPPAGTVAKITPQKLVSLKAILPTPPTEKKKVIRQTLTPPPDANESPRPRKSAAAAVSKVPVRVAATAPKKPSVQPPKRIANTPNPQPKSKNASKSPKQPLTPPATPPLVLAPKAKAPVSMLPKPKAKTRPTVKIVAQTAEQEVPICEQDVQKPEVTESVEVCDFVEVDLESAQSLAAVDVLEATETVTADVSDVIDTAEEAAEVLDIANDEDVQQLEVIEPFVVVAQDDAAPQDLASICPEILDEADMVEVEVVDAVEAEVVDMVDAEVDDIADSTEPTEDTAADEPMGSPTQDAVVNAEASETMVAVQVPVARPEEPALHVQTPVVEVTCGNSSSSSTIEEPEAVPRVSSGIQARLAALYGSSEATKLAAAVLPGAYVRRLKFPELLDGAKASRNPQTQREIDGLRSMNRVASGGQTLVKTRAFGGNIVQ